MTIAKQFVIGHRGVPSIAPENTLSSFQMAERINLSWIECDVNIIGDGTLVIFHDRVLDRCSSHSGSLLSLEKKDLENIDAGSWFSPDFSRDRILTLEQFIHYINQTQLNVNLEIKAIADKHLNNLLLKNLNYMLTEHWSIKRKLIVSSFNHPILQKFAKKMSKVTIACLFTHQMLEQDWKQAIQKVGAKYIHPSEQHLTEDHIKQMKTLGYNINVWTVNNIQRAKQLYSWGVSGICTDIPQKFPQQYLHAK